MMKKRLVTFVSLASIAAVSVATLLTGSTFGVTLSNKQQLGKLLYFDRNLSTPQGQACADCHSPKSGYAEPHKSLPVSQGVLKGCYGNRNAPVSAYAAFSPVFQLDSKTGEYVGGQFWDGRAATLADQAKGPFLNPLEMHNPDKAAVVGKVRQSNYSWLFKRVFGSTALDDVDMAYDKIAEAIADYEGSSEVCKFTSKYDAYLDGKAKLSLQEQRGLALFEGKAHCASCHPNRPSADGKKPLFTNFGYENIGIPKNWENPFLYMSADKNPAGKDYIDLGLGGALKDAAQNGKFKVPTLRNINASGPYGHNGYFTSLSQVVDFYNTRDVKGWAAPEVSLNVDKTNMGNLGLTKQEVTDLVMFLKTLSDR